jgi:hypothetical protein
MSVDPGPTAGPSSERSPEPAWPSSGCFLAPTSPSVHYPAVAPAEPGEIHQADLFGPCQPRRGRVRAFNLTDVGSHEAASQILPGSRPSLVAAGLVRNWERRWWPSPTTTRTSGASSCPPLPASAQWWLPVGIPGQDSLMRGGSSTPISVRNQPPSSLVGDGQQENRRSPPNRSLTSFQHT